MFHSRRSFLGGAAVGMLGGAAACRKPSSTPATELPPGAPPAFGTTPAVGPEVTSTTFAEGSKLVQVQMTAPERDVAANSWRTTMAALYERRTGPRKIQIGPETAPATLWNPVLPGLRAVPERDHFVRPKIALPPLPSDDREIAFSPVSHLSRWIEARKLTSERLTGIYLERIGRFDSKLRCIITLMRDQALAQARNADREIAAGKYRGPLHGIPWGAKDLVDTRRRADYLRRRTLPGSRAFG